MGAGILIAPDKFSRLWVLIQQALLWAVALDEGLPTIINKYYLGL